MPQSEFPEGAGDSEQHHRRSESRQQRHPVESAGQSFDRNSGGKGNGDNEDQPIAQPAGIEAKRPASGMIHAQEYRQYIFHPHQPEGQRSQYQKEAVNDHRTGQQHRQEFHGLQPADAVAHPH